MFKGILISLALVMSSTAALAADHGGRIFVLRAPIPGKEPGVLPAYAFEQVKPGSGGSTDTPSDNSGGFAFQSDEWDLWSDAVTNITVSLSGSDISKRIVVIAPTAMKDSICSIRDQKTPSAAAESFFQYLGANIGRLDFQPKVTGKLAVVAKCQRTVGQNVQVYAERLLITANP